MKINAIMSDYLDPNNEELLKDFFIEAEMQVDALEQNILVLENDPSDHDAIDEIFRAAHTLKGAAATVQMTKMSEFTHLVEDVLDAIRSDEVHAGEQVVDILLNSIDVIKGMLSAQKEGSSYDEDISDLQSKLRSLLQSGTVAPQPGGKRAAAQTTAAVSAEQSAPAAQTPAAVSGTSTLSEYDLLELKAAAEAGETVYQVMIEFNEDHPMNSIGGIQVFAAMKDIGTVLKTVPDFEQLYEDQFFPVVYYYVSSDSPVDAIERKVHIPEVVLETQVTPVDQMAAGAAEQQPEAAREAPVQAASRDYATKESPAAAPA